MATKFEKVAGQQIVLDPEKVTANRRVWDSAARTDPDFTKPAKPWGKEITAIDSYYNILRATELWGPMGIGWGYTAETQIVDGPPPSRIVMVTLELWYRENELRHHCGPVFACNQLVSDKGRIDDEAAKKATTDALTKSLSYLGFSADVFLGAFDDNKYVTQQREANRAVRVAGMPEDVKAAVAGAMKITSLPDLETAFFAIWGNAAKGIERMAGLASCTAAQLEYIKLQFSRRKAELAPDEPGEAAAA